MAQYTDEYFMVEAKKLIEKITDQTGCDQHLAKQCALIICTELSERLPNMNFTPPIHRLPADNYMQFWMFGVPSALNNLIPQ